MKFTPTGLVDDGLNLLVIKFMQHLLYGYFNGHCTIEGEVIKIENVLGTVEHVRARY